MDILADLILARAFADPAIHNGNDTVDFLFDAELLPVAELWYHIDAFCAHRRAAVNQFYWQLFVSFATRAPAVAATMFLPPQFPQVNVHRVHFVTNLVLGAILESWDLTIQREFDLRDDFRKSSLHSNASRAQE
ncbi:hypothetical protein FRC08_009031 [Ceratobasidium sp. 394]|nr:hypothetical protein FRC08_009031 [Ceratobasidium sp. 394]